MTIGELAEKVEIERQTIRYYESRGLLEAAGRTEGNYRVYDESSVTRLQFIKRAKTLGFTLKDIRELIRISESKDIPCCDVSEFVKAKLDKVKEQIASLTQIEAALTDLHHQCESRAKTAHCPILDDLTGVQRNN